ncbi:MAG: NAD(P)/FAD-dependent oxidoreductase [Vicinamibacterales bacterium]
MPALLSPPDAVDVLVVGAGPTGLGAAQRLQERGADWALVEAEAHAGGLAGSFIDAAGFTWDYGGHVQHSHYDSFDRAMDAALAPGDWLVHRRHSSVWVHGRFVPYPLQHHLHYLDAGDCARMIEGLRQAARARTEAPGPPAHFDAWLEASFGRPLADLFMRPYNRKVWQYPLDELDYGWIADRVAVPDVEDLADAIAARRDRSDWGPNATFRYPRHGGTGAPWRAIAAALPAERAAFGQRVTGVDLGRRVVTLTHGRRVRYRSLVTTLPLDVLLRISENPAPPRALDPAQLRFSSIDVVGVGIEGTPPPDVAERCWMYFPDASSPYFRVTLLSRYSPYNVPSPGDAWSLMAEVAGRPGESPHPEALRKEVPAALRRDLLLPPDARIVTVAHRHCVRGYPTPFLGRDNVVEAALAWFETYGVFSRGRFGAWKYEVSNQDHSYAQGREAVDRICEQGGRSLEPTLWTPTIVNGRRNA